MKQQKILRVRLNENTPLGAAAVPEKHVGHDSRIDDARIKLSWDKDPRFIRLDIDRDGCEFCELIPLSNVASIMVDKE